MLKNSGILLLSGFAFSAGLCGCDLFVTDADREVYKLIEQRQLAALGETTDVRLSEEGTRASALGDPYAFVPHPVTPEVPPEFASVAPQEGNPGAGDDAPQDQEPPPEEAGAEQDAPATDPDSPQPIGDTLDEDPPQDEDDELDFGEPFTLADALAYAIRRARVYQDAKEDLYLQTLALTLERHLWTPRFMSNLRATYTEFPQESDPDRALQGTADVAVEQRLPFGGQVVAQWIGTMVRDLENHVTNSESGTAILRADIPLLRGAGRVAYESRYQAERNLIYAVRTYERFRRDFLSQVAGEYFNLLSSKANIGNSILSRESRQDNWESSQALANAERIIRLEADRARVAFLQARNLVVNARESYETDLDEFKILIGMPTTTPIDVVEEGLDLPEPDVNEQLAIDTALRLRLDLLTALDRVDDARRDLKISRNNLLPDLNISGSVAYTTNPDHLSSLNFREDAETWNLGVDLEIPLDRKAERNFYRSTLISLRRAERGYDLFSDRVRLQVRRALRSIEQAKFTLLIQAEQIKINEKRREQAQIQFDKGQISNRDIVDADDDLLQARNAYDDAQSDLRRAILAFRLATGTMRVGDDGRWGD